MRAGALCLALVACSEVPTLSPPPADESVAPLSDLGFFAGDIAALEPADGVLPYTVISELWADFARKDRFLFVPEGETVGFDTGEDWAFPVGSVAIKTFSFPEDLREPDGARRIIETRLIVREEEGWVAEVYLWNDEQTDAVRFAGGARIDVTHLDVFGIEQTHEYIVPNTNQCGSCHARDDRLRLLGVVTPQMNHEVEREGGAVQQLEWLSEQGLFGEAVSADGLEAFADPHGEGPIEPRARAWLHANCAHCHRPGGNGGSSGLVLLAWETEPLALGICKTPAAAGAGTGGHAFDVVPGSPAESILPFRIASSEPAIRMPELPNRIHDGSGLALVEGWIAGLEPAGCPSGD